MCEKEEEGKPQEEQSDTSSSVTTVSNTLPEGAQAEAMLEGDSLADSISSSDEDST